MDVAKSEFPMKEFEEEYGRGRYFEKLDFKRLSLDLRKLFGDTVFAIPQMMDSC